MAATRKVPTASGTTTSLSSGFSNWYDTWPPTPTPNSRAIPGVRMMSWVEVSGGSRPRKTVTRSCVKNSPCWLPAMPSVGKASSTWPSTIGLASRPSQAEALVTPGMCATSAIGVVVAVGMLTVTSLALVAPR